MAEGAHGTVNGIIFCDALQAPSAKRALLIARVLKKPRALCNLSQMLEGTFRPLDMGAFAIGPGVLASAI
jgi:hypothetical protein